MKNSNNNHGGPEISEPTSAEIIKTIEAVKKKYSIVLSRDDAIRFAKLAKELSWWHAAEEGSDIAKKIAEEIAIVANDYIKNSRGAKLSKEEAYQKAMESFEISVRKETERISNEMRAIISKY